MNANEPVAWVIDTLDGKHLMLYGSNPPPVFDSEVNAIPLYTHPVKELTDEEIKSLIPDTGAWWCEVGEDNAIDFARAIEAKVRGDK